MGGPSMSAYKGLISSSSHRANLIGGSLVRIKVTAVGDLDFFRRAVVSRILMYLIAFKA